MVNPLVVFKVFQTRSAIDQREYHQRGEGRGQREEKEQFQIMLTTNIQVHVYIKVKFSIPLISSYLFKNVFCQTKFCELDARVCCRACKMIEIWVGYQYRVDPQIKLLFKTNQLVSCKRHSRRSEQHEIKTVLCYLNADMIRHNVIYV